MSKLKYRDHIGIGWIVWICEKRHSFMGVDYCKP